MFGMARSDDSGPARNPAAGVLLGIDTGGTFTDFVLFDGRGLRTHKQLSTPEAPEKAILAGLDALGVEPAGALVMVHGSTVGTNAVLEGAGVRTAYVTNRGFADVPLIGRQAREAIYDLCPAPRTLVPEELCLETGGRLDARGEVVEDLTAADIEALQQALARLAPEAVAVNLLFSFADDRFERRLEDALAARYFVSRSSRVLPEYREFERGIVTWLNSYIGPVMRGYLRRLRAALPRSRLSVMQSNGNLMAADKAGDYAVNLLLSGPAGGVMAVARLAEALGHARVLGLDIGGTSTDVSVFAGDIELTVEGRVGAYPVAIPMIDIHTIGAGGGSIAHLDSDGLLRVGPESAGADPGPVCYGRGGDRPTVTDANLLLGRLPERLANGLALDARAARAAMAPLARAMDMSEEQAAAGILEIANEHMAEALRVMSVQKGYDPAEFLLAGFGAAGGLHVCALAERMGMRRALAPLHAGVFSALGMLLSPPGMQTSQTLWAPLEGLDDDRIEERYRRLLARVLDEMRAQGVAVTHSRRFAELRYRGQSHCLKLPGAGVRALAEGFHRAHEELHGYRLDMPIELVNLRVEALGEPALTIDAVRDACRASRQAGADKEVVEGPNIVATADATVYVAENWRARPDGCGSLLLERA